MKKKYMNINKFIEYPTRYDLQYWKKDHEVWLEVSSYEFENEIELIVRELNKENISSLMISTYGNNYQINMENFKYLTFIKELSLDSGSYINVNNLYLLNDLTSLWINNENYGEEIDLIRFKSLKKLIISNSCINIKGLFELSNLITLKLQKFNEIDLSKFCLMNNLTSLELVQSSIKTLCGIENMNNLKCLTIFYLTKLTSLANINVLKELEYFEIRNCKKISNYNEIKNLSNLKRLSIYDSSSIDNLDFILNLKKLNFFGLINTNVGDGNIEPLINVPNHGYTNKKNFNYFCKNGKDIKK